MTLDVIWRSIAWPGLEHVVWPDGDVTRWDGEAVHVLPEGTVRVTYALTADQSARTREVTVTAESTGVTREIRLLADDDGWHDLEGRRPDLDGCIDVDISTTPLTNTLPIRRLGLTPGERADLLVVYIDVPELTVTPMRQHYTALWDDGGRRAGYRYESGDFQADLTVDEHGLVIDYAGLWTRRPTATTLKDTA